MTQSRIPLTSEVFFSLTIPFQINSLRSVSVIAGVLGRAGQRGQARRKANAKIGLCTWNNPADVQAFIGNQSREADSKQSESPEEGSRQQEGSLRDAVAEELNVGQPSPQF